MQISQRNFFQFHLVFVLTKETRTHARMLDGWQKSIVQTRMCCNTSKSFYLSDQLIRWQLSHAWIKTGQRNLIFAISGRTEISTKKCEINGSGRRSHAFNQILVPTLLVSVEGPAVIYVYMYVCMYWCMYPKPKVVGIKIVSSQQWLTRLASAILMA